MPQNLQQRFNPDGTPSHDRKFRPEVRMAGLNVIGAGVMINVGSVACCCLCRHVRNAAFVVEVAVVN